MPLAGALGIPFQTLADVGVMYYQGLGNCRYGYRET